MKSKNRYHAKWTKCGQGHNHHSRAEALYCDRLALMERAGEIWSFAPQWEAHLPGGTWRADFWVKLPGGFIEVHEIKGAPLRGAAATLWNRIRREFRAAYPMIPLRVFRLRRGAWTEDDDE